jgi:putative Ca2+/H+ antiporter (TMEM165/GDT1 family)
LESEKKDTFAHVDTTGSSGTLSHTVGSTLKDTLPYTEGKQPPPVVGDGTEGIIQPFHSFVLAFTMIIFSEIGDKTFLVAALMAMRHPQLVVFSGAFSALITMTILSAVLGHAVPTLLPKHLTAWLAAGLFLIFGAKLMREGLEMDKDAGVGEEMQEVEAELEEKEHLARKEGRRRSSVSPYVLEAGRGRRSGSRHKFPARAQSPSSDSSRSPSPSGRGVKASASNALGGLNNLLGLLLSPAWVQTFVMTFLGEWGDRSQIATIAMAAGQDYWWVTGGAIAGHMICTGIAVIGGRALAGRVSLRVGMYMFTARSNKSKLTHHSHFGWSNCFHSLRSHLLFPGSVRLDDVHIT